MSEVAKDPEDAEATQVENNPEDGTPEDEPKEEGPAE